MYWKLLQHFDYYLLYTRHLSFLSFKIAFPVYIVLSSADDHNVFTLLPLCPKKHSSDPLLNRLSWRNVVPRCFSSQNYFDKPYIYKVMIHITPSLASWPQILISFFRTTVVWPFCVGVSLSSFLNHKKPDSLSS